MNVHKYILAAFIGLGICGIQAGCTCESSENKLQSYRFANDLHTITIDGIEFYVLDPLQNGNCGYTAISFDRNTVEYLIKKNMTNITKNQSLLLMLVDVINDYTHKDRNEIKRNLNDSVELLFQNHIRLCDISDIGFDRWMSYSLMELIATLCNLRIIVYDSTWDEHGQSIGRQDGSVSMYVYRSGHHWQRLIPVSNIRREHALAFINGSRPLSKDDGDTICKEKKTIQQLKNSATENVSSENELKNSTKRLEGSIKKPRKFSMARLRTNYGTSLLNQSEVDVTSNTLCVKEKVLEDETKKDKKHTKQLVFMDDISFMFHDKSAITLNDVINELKCNGNLARDVIIQHCINSAIDQHMCMHLYIWDVKQNIIDAAKSDKGWFVVQLSDKHPFSIRKKKEINSLKQYVSSQILYRLLRAINDNNITSMQIVPDSKASFFIEVTLKDNITVDVKDTKQIEYEDGLKRNQGYNEKNVKVLMEAVEDKTKQVKAKPDEKGRRLTTKTIRFVFRIVRKSENKMELEIVTIYPSYPSNVE